MSDVKSVKHLKTDLHLLRDQLLHTKLKALNNEYVIAYNMLLYKDLDLFAYAKTKEQITCASAWADQHLCFPLLRQSESFFFFF